jgi:hypothetical protein
MGTYAPFFSPRWRSKYRCAGVVHTCQIRAVRSAGEAAVRNLAGTMHDLFNNWAILLCDDFEWIESSYALTDSDVFIPWTNPVAVTGTLAINLYSPQQKVTATTHSGRSAHSKAHFSIYGIHWDFGPGYPPPSDRDPFNGVVTGTENAAVLANQTLANGTPLASGAGEAALWYSQVTVKPNDYLWKQVRKGLIA